MCDNPFACVPLTARSASFAGSAEMAQPTTSERADSAPSTSPEDLEDLAHMEALATKYGYVCQKKVLWQQEFSASTASRMVPRLGDKVYQMMAFSIPNLPRAVLQELLPAESEVTSETAAVATWLLDDTATLTATMAPLLAAACGYVCAGSSRAHQTKSEPVMRVLAKLMPPLEISHVVLASGLERTYVNGMYALVTEHGEMHWPKDNERREIQVDPEVESSLRWEVLVEVRALADQGRSLSAGWWRQLGDEARALQVEHDLANPRAATASRRAAARAAAAPPKKKKHRRFTKETYEIDVILAEKKVNSKERKHFLVRWCGYDSSWEPARVSGQVGGPMETWEPLLLVAPTEAYEKWRQREA